MSDLSDALLELADSVERSLDEIRAVPLVVSGMLERIVALKAGDSDLLSECSSAAGCRLGVGASCCEIELSEFVSLRWIT